MPATAPSLRPLSTNVPSLTERTIEAVREAIRTQILVPGELYSVYQLATELGVSRSPVRDALLRLAETGMVRFERNRGFRVMLPGPQDLAEMIAIRLALEVPAARRAAPRTGPADAAALTAACQAMAAAAAAGDEAVFMLHDQRLHALILDLAGNGYARRIIDNLRDATRLTGASTVERSRSLTDVYAEHLPIVTALVAQDADGAADAMRHHIEQTGRLLLHDAVLREAAARIGPEPSDSPESAVSAEPPRPNSAHIEQDLWAALIE
jgi:DNA-binding GntR family transcriptional regulator